jgi:hypothetical protein
MNCTACRYELSQCLDGRLPSGRRAVVLQHASQCEECGTFWEELQAAQLLTLRLQQPRVSENFRESLWERVQAGEGTPDAVFREPVPMLAKLRYALTGAAAAAAALLSLTWFGPHDDAATTRPVAKLEPRASNVGASPIVVDSTGASARFASDPAAQSVGNAWLISSTQRLGLNQVAREAAKQFDNRLAETTAEMRRAENGNKEAIEQVFVTAREVVSVGDLLLYMRDRGSLLFTEPAAECDLRVAVRLLAQSRQEQPSLKTIHEIVRPALQSGQLMSMARKISLVPLDPHEDQDAMAWLKIQRPDILPKLFVIVSSGDEAGRWFRADAMLQMDDCGWSYGVPLSEVQASEHQGRSVLSRPH